MKHDEVFQIVKVFLSERGYDLQQNQSDTDPIELNSLDYVALLLHVERSLNLVVDDSVFFEDGIPVTLSNICERLTLAVQSGR